MKKNIARLVGDIVPFSVLDLAENILNSYMDGTLPVVREYPAILSQFQEKGVSTFVIDEKIRDGDKVIGVIRRV